MIYFSNSKKIFLLIICVIGLFLAFPNFSKVNINKVVNTKKFDLEEAENHPLWSKELYNFKEHVPETEEYGIRSFVYHSINPFNPEKIMNFFDNIDWPGVVRAKGFFWLATRPEPPVKSSN